ncbi:MAG: DDE-type integrase/transposase/recombinase [archaeon]|nr:DDE-type integrase/transposase/recombinase [archaeon]
MERERTPQVIVYFAVYLVFEGLSFRACARAIEPFVKRTHKAVWDWYQDIGSNKSFHKLFRLGRERVRIFAVDETVITIAGMQAFLFIAYEPFEDRILGLQFAWTANSIAVERFLDDLTRKYGHHPVWTDGAEWYSLACQSMNLRHHVYEHGTWLWEVMERAVQRLKDRTESFDDLFPCRNQGSKCRFAHINNWINVFWLHNQPMYHSFIKAIKNVLI